MLLHQLKKLLPKQAILCALLFSFGVSYAQVNVLWESRFTSAGQNSDTGKEMDIDANGNVYVTGTSWTNATNGFDIVTVKYNTLGVQKWVATFNGSGSALDEARDVKVDKNGNVYVTGYTASTGANYNYITIKYDSLGNQLWASTYNGTGNGFDEAYTLIVDSLGNTYVTGSADAGSQGSNFVTIKYNAAGVQQWATSYNGPGNSLDAATEIALDNQLNIYVSGKSFGSGTDLDIATIKYNNSGVQQWVSRYNGALNFFDVPNALSLDNLNNVYVAGATYGGLATLNDYVTIKINNAGTQQWAKTFDGPLNDEDIAYDVITDQNQNVYVTGRSMGINGTAQNILTLKYNPTGVLLWQNTYNGPSSGFDEGKQMRIGASGSLYVTGFSAGNGTNNDYLTLKYNPTSGNIIWKARFDGPASNNDQAFAMEIDGSESIYVTGTSQGATTGQDFSTIKWCQFTTNAGNDVTICAGDTTQLNAAPLDAISYAWSPTVGLSNSTISNPLAFPTVTTTYYISATNALGCTDVDTIIVTVNNLPLATITTSGPTTFCVGDSVTLTTSSNSSYVWSTGDTTQSIKVFTTGNYTVNVTDSNTCGMSSQQSVTVNPLPIVSAGPDKNVCNGSSVQLNASGATIYTWNTQNTLSDSTISSPIVNPTIPTIYWVEGEDINGCKNIDSVFIAISITPDAAMSNSSPNDTLYLNLPNGGDIQFFSTASVNALTFNWDFGDGGISILPNPTYTYTTPGLYKVNLRVANGQCLDSVASNIRVLLLFAINEQAIDNGINAYPNPANDIITIDVKNSSLKIEDAVLINSIGKIIWNKQLINQQTIKINTSRFKSGIYFLQLKTNNKIFYTRVVIYH